MVIAGSGHRPQKLGGYDNKAFKKLIQIAETWLEENKPTQVISGMALGWDLTLAQATINKNIPLVCAIPCIGQSKMWSKKDQNLYLEILAKANKIVHVSDKPYNTKCMQKRNEWMVDNSDVILAMWDGTMGGTFNCLEYAKNKQKTIINLYDIWKHTK